MAEFVQATVNVQRDVADDAANGTGAALTSFSARSTTTVIVEVLCVRPTGVKVRSEDRTSCASVFVSWGKMCLSAAVKPECTAMFWFCTCAHFCLTFACAQVLAGSTEPAFVDGDAAASRLNFPQSICQPDADTLLIADRSNGSVRRFDLKSGRLDAFVGRALHDADDADAAAVVDGHGVYGMIWGSEAIVWALTSRVCCLCLLLFVFVVLFSVVCGLAGAIHKDDARLHGPSALCIDPTAADTVLIACDDKQKVIRRLTADQNVRTQSQKTSMVC